MPTNTTPEYKTAEAEFRRARTPEDRLACLREMLKTLPKHKGTEHLQADIRARIKELTDELAGPKKGGAHTGPATAVRPEGAAQVALVGPPNSGKSALHARLTGSQAAVAPYPFTTQWVQSGMLPFLDVAFQLVDLPPVSAGHPVPWLANTLRSADAGLLVVDLGDPACVDQVEELHQLLAERRIILTGSWDPPPEEDDDPFATRLPVLLIATKADQIPHLDDELAALRDLTGYSYPAVAASATSGEGLDRIGPFLFERLQVVRVYTKIPGAAPNTTRPYTVRHGQTVEDVAALIHKDLAESLRYARLWREGFEGGHVGRDHPVQDGDILELHTR